ncbi:hypothetical protein [Flavicella sediminum]|uniref:hypothetical protein n=1 Tax=Flavicella sediminum TaxID=2585141 RepID=UPI001123EFF1|nr:hypothetical protein [Flavicella sediminum]
MTDQTLDASLFEGDAREVKSPTGWGRQYYSGKMIRKIKNYRTDLSRPNELKKMSFMQRFMAEHITGLKRRKRDGSLD